MAFLYNGDKCPKCTRLMILNPPIPVTKPDARMTCINCNYKAPLRDFAKAMDEEFGLDENGEVT